jgi:hypothetical protein
LAQGIEAVIMEMVLNNFYWLKDTMFKLYGREKKERRGLRRFVQDLELLT